jgi:hypothetical protein
VRVSTAETGKLPLRSCESRNSLGKHATTMTQISVSFHPRLSAPIRQAVHQVVAHMGSEALQREQQQAVGGCRIGVAVSHVIRSSGDIPVVIEDPARAAAVAIWAAPAPWRQHHAGSTAAMLVQCSGPAVALRFYLHDIRGLASTAAASGSLIESARLEHNCHDGMAPPEVLDFLLLLCHAASDNGQRATAQRIRETVSGGVVVMTAADVTIGTQLALGVALTLHRNGAAECAPPPPEAPRMVIDHHDSCREDAFRDTEAWLLDGRDLDPVCWPFDAAVTRGILRGAWVITAEGAAACGATVQVEPNRRQARLQLLRGLCDLHAALRTEEAWMNFFSRLRRDQRPLVASALGCVSDAALGKAFARFVAVMADPR